MPKCPVPPAVLIRPLGSVPSCHPFFSMGAWKRHSVIVFGDWSGWLAGYQACLVISLDPGLVPGCWLLDGSGLTARMPDRQPGLAPERFRSP